MPEANSNLSAGAPMSSDQRKLLDDLCPLHQTPMVRTAQHVGDGKVEYSDPQCPLCEDLKSRGLYDEAKTSIERATTERTAKLADLAKEQAPRQAVKPIGDAPAAKT